VREVQGFEWSLGRGVNWDCRVRPPTTAEDRRPSTTKALGRRARLVNTPGGTRPQRIIGWLELSLEWPTGIDFYNKYNLQNKQTLPSRVGGYSNRSQPPSIACRIHPVSPSHNDFRHEWAALCFLKRQAWRKSMCPDNRVCQSTTARACTSVRIDRTHFRLGPPRSPAISLSTTTQACMHYRKIKQSSGDLRGSRASATLRSIPLGSYRTRRIPFDIPRISSVRACVSANFLPFETTAASSIS